MEENVGKGKRKSNKKNDTDKTNDKKCKNTDLEGDKERKENEYDDAVDKTCSKIANTRKNIRKSNSSKNVSTSKNETEVPEHSDMPITQPDNKDGEKRKRVRKNVERLNNEKAESSNTEEIKTGKVKIKRKSGPISITPTENVKSDEMTKSPYFSSDVKTDYHKNKKSVSPAKKVKTADDDVVVDKNKSEKRSTSRSNVKTTDKKNYKKNDSDENIKTDGETDKVKNTSRSDSKSQNKDVKTNKNSSTSSNSDKIDTPEKKRTKKSSSISQNVSKMEKNCVSDIKKTKVDKNAKLPRSKTSKSNKDISNDNGKPTVKRRKSESNNTKTVKMSGKTKTQGKSNRSSAMSKNRFSLTKLEDLTGVDDVSRVLMEMEGPSHMTSEMSSCDQSCDMSGDQDSEADSDWEHVEDEHDPAHELTPKTVTPTDVEVVIKRSENTVKKKFDPRAYFRQIKGRFIRKVQLQCHQIQLMCLLSHGRFTSSLCNNPLLHAIILSILPPRFMNTPILLADAEYLRDLLTWFRGIMKLQHGDEHDETIHRAALEGALLKKSAPSTKIYVAMFVVVLRMMQHDTRLVASFQPMPIKIDPHSEVCIGKQVLHFTPTTSHMLWLIIEILQSDKEDKATVESKDNSTESDESESPQPSTSKQQKPSAKRKSAQPREQEEKKARLKPDKDKPKLKRSVKATDYWVEVFLASQDQWICIDVVNDTIDKPETMEWVCTPTIHYCLAFNNEGAVKDVTCRYASKWLTQTWRLRVDRDWWRQTVGVYKTSNVDRDQDENLLLTVQQTDKPIPTTISEIKNHPLYVLRRHLLKFEGLYPPTVPPLGFIKDEPIYARECVKTLHTRKTWIREGRCVKKHKQNDPMEPVYGEWQTEPYEPPAAENGIVPKNEYGNVELFKSAMLSRGTVHLPYNGMLRVAKKLNIDVAPALTGFELRKGFNVPTFEGVIVCTEYKDTLMAAYEEDILTQRQRARDKRIGTILDNWKRLVKSLFIRERLRAKYDLKSKPMEDQPTTSISPHVPTNSTHIDYGLLKLVKEAQDLKRIYASWTDGGKVYLMKTTKSKRTWVKNAADFARIMR